MRAPILIVALVSIGLLLGCGNAVDSDLAEKKLHVSEIAVGDGETAEIGDHVIVSIEAWSWSDGAQGEPVEVMAADSPSLELRAGEVMPGLLEGIVGMREGGERRIVMAPEKVTARFRPIGLPRDAALACNVTLAEVVRVRTEELQAGDGQAAAVGDYVEIDYTGWHADENGEKADQFISSEENGQPARLLIGAGMVNDGLDIGLVGLRVGGARRIMVPPELGYGDQGQDDVRPGATLIYEVDLREIYSVTTQTLREGSGPALRDGDQVKFFLQGWIRNDDGSKGEQFQITQQQVTPFVTILGRFKVQPGIELGMRQARRGEVFRVDVPSALAFGSQGYHRGPRTLVPPDTDVIYEVEIVDDGTS
jgi:FKBP-type peptidyl-prolyl cis-trans isomerase